jgi:hypothetical protein
MSSSDLSKLMRSTAHFLGDAEGDVPEEHFTEEMQKLDLQLKRMAATCTSLECAVERQAARDARQMERRSDAA